MIRCLSSTGRARTCKRALLEAYLEGTRDRLLEGIGHSHAGFTALNIPGSAPMYFAILAIGDSQQRADEAGVVWSLTPRQREVLRLRLGVSVRTVEVHVAAIFAKVGVSGRAELVARALSLRSPCAMMVEWPLRRGTNATLPAIVRAAPPAG